MVQGKETAKKVLVILVTGVEQIEVGIHVDAMRRAKIEVTLVGLISESPKNRVKSLINRQVIYYLLS